VLSFESPSRGARPGFVTPSGRGVRTSLLLLLCFAAVVPIRAGELLRDKEFRAFDPGNVKAQWGWRVNHPAPASVVRMVDVEGRLLPRLLESEKATNPTAIYQRVRGFDPAAAYTFTVWAKGAGKLMLFAYRAADPARRGQADGPIDMAQHTFTRHKGLKYLRSFHSQDMQLADEWQACSWSFTPGDEVDVLSAAIHVTGGDAWLRQAALYPKGFDPDEEVVRLAGFRTEGCAFAGGTLVVPAEYEQAQGADRIVMAAERAHNLSFASERGGVHGMSSAAGGAAVNFSSGLDFRFRVARPGTYRAWYRAWVPMDANWSHAERMDDGPERTNIDDRPGDEHPVKAWFWTSGPTYELSAGEHVWRILNWHGGIFLDQVLLTLDADYAPRGAEAESPIRASGDKVTAVSSVVKPLSVAGWRQLRFDVTPASARANVQAYYSLDRGARWTAAPENNDLSALPVKGAGEDSLRIRLEMTAAATGCPLVSNPLVTYKAGEHEGFVLEGRKVRVKLAGAQAGVVELLNKAKGLYCIQARAAAPLFTLTETCFGADGSVRLLSSSAGEALLERAEIKKAPGLQTFLFGYSLKGGKVRVSGELRVDDTELIRGRITVENEAENDIVALGFPLLRNLAVGGDAEDDTLIIPFTQGRKIPYPAAQQFGYPRYWTWPGSLSMCYTDLYDEAKDAGLYLSSCDEQATTTQFLMQGAPDGASFGTGLRKWVRVRKGETYTSPEAVIGLHAGDWHWAADRYREWAQTWMKVGENTPRWFKESDGCVQGFVMHGSPFYAQDGAARKGVEMGSLLWATWAHMTDATGGCGLYPYPCPWFGGGEGFRFLNDRIHDFGGHSNYYIGASLYVPPYCQGATHIGNLPSSYLPEAARRELPDRGFYERVKVIEPDGSARPFKHAELLVDAASREWQDFLIKWTLRYIRDYHADGIYYDHLGIQVAWPSINYRGHDSTGDWGRGQLRLLRTVKEEGRKVNPDVVFGMEGAGDVYLRWADWGLVGGQNAMEMFSYTFPEAIQLLGPGSSALGMDEVAVGFLNAFRMDHHWLARCPYQRGLPPKYRNRLAGQLVASIRRQVNPFLFRARFRDNVGLRLQDPGKLQAKWMVRNQDGNRGALVFVSNAEASEKQRITVSTRDWGPVRVAWAVGHDYFRRLAASEARQSGEQFWFIAPIDKFSAVLLVNECEPLVDKRLAPLGLPLGKRVEGAVTVRNVNPVRERVSVRVRGPGGPAGARRSFVLPPGVAREVTLDYGVDKGSVGERIDLLLDVAWGERRMDWLLPARVVAPVDARLVHTGKRKLELRVANRGGRKLSGGFVVETGNGLAVSPSKGRYSVKPGETFAAELAADLPAVEAPAPVRARVTYRGGETEAQFQAFPTVFNGGFEFCNFGLGVGLPDGYWLDRNLRQAQDDLSKVPHTVTDSPYEGKRCLMLEPKAWLGSWNVLLRPNARYRLACAIKRSAPGGGIVLSAVGDAWSVRCGDTKAPKLNEWETFQAEFATGPEDRWFRWLQCVSSAEGATWFDAIRIEEIEEE